MNPILLFGACLFAACARAGAPVELTCEWLENPVGVETRQPRLAWKLPDDLPVQTGWEVEAKGTDGASWTTRREGADQVEVVWGGSPLADNERVRWRVRAYGSNGKATDWSDWSRFTLGRKAWSAKWIAAADAEITPRFVKSFAVRKGLVRATLNVTGVGFYEAELNGVKIGKKVLDPAPTAYDKRVLYSVYELEDSLAPGTNMLALTVGHGWYDQRAVGWSFENAPWRDKPRALAQLELIYADGSRETVVTDGSWQLTASGVLYDDIREGETQGREKYVFRRTTVEEVPAPKGVLACATLPGAEVVECFRPVAIERLSDDEWLLDFGVNLAGRIRYTPRDPMALKGHKVHFRHDERKPPQKRRIDNHVKCFGSRSHSLNGAETAFQTDHCTFAGLPGEFFEPKFVYHGFQYVTVKGLSEKPSLDEFEAQAINTAMRTTGSFACSDPDFNALMKMTDRSFRSNWTDGYPTDCPHREKNGWTGDAAIASYVGQYFYENTAAYEKWIQDVVDAQLPDGRIPMIVPTGDWGYDIPAWTQGGAGPAWDQALVIVPWRIWECRGDRRILEMAHPAILKMLRHTAEHRDEKGLIPWGLPEWAAAAGHGLSPHRPFVTTCFFLLSCRTAERIAQVLGKAEDATLFARWADESRAALRRHYLQEDGSWEDASQTAQALAFEAGLCETEAERSALVDFLDRELAEYDGHLSVGILGFEPMLNLYSEIGRTDIAYNLLVNPTPPSPVASWLKIGSTTLRESFDSGASWNHIMFGAFAGWAYRHLAGIRGEEGFRRVTIAPRPGRRLTWLTASTETPYGTVASGWKIENGRFALTVRIPSGTTGVVVLPDGTRHEIVPGERSFACPMPAARPEPHYVTTHRHDPLHWVGSDLSGADRTKRNRLLMAVELRGADEETKRVFYTLENKVLDIHTNVADTATRTWVGTDGVVRKSRHAGHFAGFDWSHDFVGNIPWDILMYHPGWTDTIIASSLDEFFAYGKLPGGADQAVAIADGYLRGLRGFESEELWRAVRATALAQGDGKSYVATAAARLARALGKSEEAAFFAACAADWQRPADLGQTDGEQLFEMCGLRLVEPCGGVYEIVAPCAPGVWFDIFDRVKFRISVRNWRKGGRVTGATLNGERLSALRLTREQVLGGGNLILDLE